MSIETDLRELKINKDNPITIDDSFYADDNVLTISSLTKKSKKDKKKKKKEKGNELTHRLDKLMGDSLNNVLDGDEDESLMELAKNIKKNSKKKGNSIIFDSDKFKDGDGEERKKKKDYIKEYRTEFKAQESLLTALLKEADMDNKQIKAIFKDLTSVKVRGFNKTLTDVMSALNTSNSNRLSIVKEMISLNKTIHDFSIKRSAQKKDSDGKNSHDPEAFGAQMFNSIFNQGRMNVMDNVRSNTSLSQEQIANIRSGASSVVNDVDTSAPDFDPDAFIDQRLQEENNPFRTEDGNKLIEYENMGPKIKVARNIDTGDWDFIAVDKFDQRIDDYPLPNKNEIGKMTFSDDTDIATDMYGRSYGVVPSID